MCHSSDKSYQFCRRYSYAPFLNCAAVTKMSSHTLLTLLPLFVALSLRIPSTRADTSQESLSGKVTETYDGESIVRFGIGNGTGNATADLQNNCNNNCNCYPTVTCAPPVNETEMTSQLLQLVRDQQQHIQTLLSLQENCGRLSASTSQVLPHDCQDLRRLGETSSRAYDIYPVDVVTPVRVYCDMGLDSEGWTVIQRREDGSINFNRSWNDYRKGFGNVNSEHWLGNDNIHLITAQGKYQLLVELEDWEGDVVKSTYDKFRVGEAATGYKLILGQHHGKAGDGLGLLNYQPFTTFDDSQPRHKCSGGWWGFESCSESSNLNGNYYDLSKALLYDDGVVWKEWKGQSYSLKRSEMKIKPQQL